MNRAQTDIRRAQAEDWPAIQNLLDGARLPAADLAPDKLECFYIAALLDSIVGVAGLQLAPPFGLLRSVVVQQKQRNVGLGAQLVAHCLKLARERSLTALYLIPNGDSAASFFRHLGFTLIERHLVPQPVRALSEFTHLCPQSHPCMHLVLGPMRAE
jgi:amino-acid N-acetyltransferase